MFRYLAILVCVIPALSMACDKPATICFEPRDGYFTIIHNGNPAPIFVDSIADPAVKHVAESFSKDLALVGESKPTVSTTIASLKESAIVIGVIGHSPLIDKLIASNKLRVDNIRGQWEAFQISVVDKPFANVDKLLVIVGSDRRGAVFGTYDLSQQLGVSPWYWFADVPVTKRKNAVISAGIREDQPKVKYRGIFINDEEPAFGGWARKKFGGINANMYKHVFELILRLKGNYLWPAMWGKAFHVDDPNNTILADQMGIVMGTSHHEPLTRAHAEWQKNAKEPNVGGAWNYETNAKNLKEFWHGGMQRMTAKGAGQSYDSLVTVGMRGDGDEPMSEDTAIKLLEKIVTDQRAIIAETTGKPASETPQVWALYKEVQDYYDSGMKVPDDITLLFADDNWGQIRRLPTQDLNRKGGFGVYYHFDYVGAPRSYKWTNTIQIEKVWQQMDLAYERGARDIWIVNVGDLKPIEYPIDFFLSMAWNPQAMDVESLGQFPKVWAHTVFGDKLSTHIADLLTRYGKYAAKRKPELLDENSYAVGSIGANTLVRGEFDRITEQWQTLEQEMLQIKTQLSSSQHDAYYQLLEYPISSMANLYSMYRATAWNRLLASQQDARANYFLKIVKQAFARDKELSKRYHSINDGKWDNMINQVHMSYVSWNDPSEQTMPSVVSVGLDENSPEVIFSVQPEASNSPISIEASAYTKAVNYANLTWQSIPNLGQSKAAVIALPQGQPSTSVSDGMHLEYEFDNSQRRDINVILQLSPSIDTVAATGIELGISLDDRPVEILNFNLQATGVESQNKNEEAWYAAVINNQHNVSSQLLDVSEGSHTLKIWRIDDNVILEKITLR